MSTVQPPRTAPSPAPAREQPHTADVLVIFGITGDLAKVMTFRSLYRLERRGLLDCPIVGVAGDDWSIEQLRKHAARMHRGHRRDARPGGVRPLRGAAVLRQRRLHRRRHLRAPALGDRRGAHAGLLPRDPAVPVRQGDRPAHRRRASRTPRAWSSRSRSGTTSPRRASSRTKSTSTSTSPSSTGSTTSSARWAPTSSSTCGSPTRWSSRSGTATTSPACRSRWPRTSVSRTAATSTTRSARCATSSSTT